jgi:hypothetical protein
MPRAGVLRINLMKVPGLDMPVAIENKGVTVATIKKINNKRKI